MKALLYTDTNGTATVTATIYPYPLPSNPSQFLGQSTYTITNNGLYTGITVPIDPLLIFSNTRFVKINIDLI